MNIEKNINKPKMKKFNGKGLKKALVSSMLALTLVANPASGVVNNNANAKTKPTIKMYGKKNYTVYTGESLKIGKTVPKYKGKKLAAKKFKVTVKKNEVSYPAIANNIKNNKAVTFASSGTYNVTYKATSPVGTTKTATRTISVVDEKYKDAPKSSDGLIVLNDDLSKYADYETITVNGNKFNVVKDYNDFKIKPKFMETFDYKYRYENAKEDGFYEAYQFLIGLGTNSPYKLIKDNPFELTGKIEIKNDKYDYSNNILVFKDYNQYKEDYDKKGTSYLYYYLCFIDENGNLIYDNIYGNICVVEDYYKYIPTYKFESNIPGNKFRYYNYSDNDEIMISPPIDDNTLFDGKKLTLNKKAKSY